MTELEIVLPCYNEGKSIEPIVARARDAAIEFGYDNQRFQLVLVENGSVDNSFEVMTQLKSHPVLGTWFRIVKVDKNQGYGFGLFSGLQSCQAPVIGWSHADQQTDIRDAFRAMNQLKSSPDQVLVKGRRLGRDKKEVFVSRVFALLAKMILGLKFDEINAQPKVFPKQLMLSLANPPKNFCFDLYVLYQASRLGWGIREIEVRFPPRVHGVSNWASTFLGRYKTILNMVRYMFRLRLSSGKI